MLVYLIVIQSLSPRFLPHPFASLSPCCWLRLADVREIAFIKLPTAPRRITLGIDLRPFPLYRPPIVLPVYVDEL